MTATTYFFKPFLISFLCFIPAFLPAFIFSYYANRQEPKSTPSHTVTLIYSVIAPMIALRRLSPKYVTRYEELYHILFIFTFIYLGIISNIISFSSLKFNNIFSIIILSIPIFVFLISSRLWCFNFTQKMLELNKRTINYDHHYFEIVEQLESVSSLLKEEQQLYTQHVTLYEKLVQKLQLQESEYTKIEQQIKNADSSIQSVYSIVEHNLKVINSIPNTTQIAVDTNVFMEWDDYLIDALRSKNLVISKRVQWELDRNKNSEYSDVRFKARRGIRHLLKFEAKNYSFINPDWNDKFLKENGLSDRWEDEKILADYLMRQKQGHEVLIASSDSNFLISAKPLFPVLNIKKPNFFLQQTD